ncbi:MAG: four helix bundle protein [Patescibacteria group bacterium]
MNNPIKSFKDLDVYCNLYSACIEVMTNIIPFLPVLEKYDLRDQLSRSCKAAPRLVAEGYAKKHQKQGFQKYIDDAMAECNECVVSLEQVKDIYHLEVERCEKLVDAYDKSARQLFNLAIAWDKFKNRRFTPPLDDTPARHRLRLRRRQGGSSATPNTN